MKLAYRTCPYRKTDIATALRRIAGEGYDGVELCLENPDISVGVLADAKIREVQGVLGETGLGLSSVSLHAPFVNNDKAFYAVKEGVAIARKFDCNVFVTHSGPRLGDDSEGEQSRLRGRIAQILEVCQEHDVLLAVEPEPKFIVESTQDAIDLMNDIASDYLRVNLDIGHAFITDADLCESIRLLGDRTVRTHVEDIAATKEHKHLIPGEGGIDFSAVVSALRSVGYGSYLTVDLFNLDPADAAGPARDVLRRACK